MTIRPVIIRVPVQMYEEGVHLDYNKCVYSVGYLSGTKED